jgi:aspartyl-tRNA(Asn)/glutamyl-tRNA(Gln) amidotransferase subunit C
VYHCRRSILHGQRARFYGELFVSLSKDQVNDIAKLARLNIAENEVDDVVDKLSRIVEFVDQLQAAPTSDVVPMAHPLNTSQRLRPDTVTERDDRDRYQANTSSVKDGLYVVPKVID